MCKQSSLFGSTSFTGIFYILCKSKKLICFVMSLTKHDYLSMTIFRLLMTGIVVSNSWIKYKRVHVVCIHKYLIVPFTISFNQILNYFVTFSLTVYIIDVLLLVVWWYDEKQVNKRKGKKWLRHTIIFVMLCHHDLQAAVAVVQFIRVF